MGGLAEEVHDPAHGPFVGACCGPSCSDGSDCTPSSQRWLRTWSLDPSGLHHEKRQTKLPRPVHRSVANRKGWRGPVQKEGLRWSTDASLSSDLLAETEGGNNVKLKHKVRSDSNQSVRLLPVFDQSRTCQSSSFTDGAATKNLKKKNKQKKKRTSDNKMTKQSDVLEKLHCCLCCLIASEKLSDRKSQGQKVASAGIHSHRPRWC